MPVEIIILINLVITAMLSGLIWMVQLVHYPGFLYISKKESFTYQQHHTRSISKIVVPLMLLELGMSIWLIFVNHQSIFFYLTSCFLLGILILIWIATFGFAIPLHNNLSSEGYSHESVKKLINVNWIRTFGWSIRLLILFYWMIQVI